MQNQSAVEFLTTYSFVFIVIVASFVLLAILSVAPKSVFPSRCTFYSGFSCIDAGYTPNSISSKSVLYLLLIDETPGVINITSFNAVVSLSASTSGSCSKQTNGIVTQGMYVYCAANVPVVASVGGAYTGTLSISANYCTSLSSSIPCKGPSLYSYAGSFSVQASAVQPAFTTTTVPTSTSMTTTTV